MDAARIDESANVASLMRSAPETLPMAALVGVAAVVATRMGVLPGWSKGIRGGVVEGVLWSSLFTGLVLGYRALALPDSQSMRSGSLRLALALLLALLTTYVCKVLSVPFLRPATWTEFFYLRFLLPPIALGLWCGALLPRETAALYATASSNKTLAPLPQLLLLLVSAAALVSISDLAFQWRGTSAVDIRLHSDIVLMNAWTINLLLVFAAYVLVLAITSKASAALLVVSPLYVALGLATLAKLEYMHSAVQPLDLIRVGEFLPLFLGFFGSATLVALLAALVGWVLALLAVRRSKAKQISRGRRWVLGILSVVVWLGSAVAVIVAPSKPRFNKQLM